MFKVLFLAVFVGLLGIPDSFGAAVQENNLHDNYYRQQMILMGMYLGGINQELSKQVPGHDELAFLGESINEIVQRIRATKGGAFSHHEYDELYETTKKLSRASNLAKAKLEAEAVMNSCGKCHSKPGKQGVK